MSNTNPSPASGSNPPPAMRRVLEDTPVKWSIEKVTVWDQSIEPKLRACLVRGVAGWSETGLGQDDWFDRCYGIYLGNNTVMAFEPVGVTA